MNDGKPMDTLCELDYNKHAEHVIWAALPLYGVTLTFKDGSERKLPYDKVKGRWLSIQNQYDRITVCKYEVKDERDLQEILKQESAARRRIPVRSLTEYIQKLAVPAKPSAVEKLETAKKSVKSPTPGKAAAKPEPER